MSSNKIEKSSEGNVTAPFTTLLPSCIVTSSSPSPMISTSAAVVPTASAATFLGSNNASSSRSRNGTEELSNHSRGLGSTSPYMNEAARNCSSILNGCEQLSGKLTSGNLSPNLYNPSTFHSDYVRLLDSLMRNHHQIPTLPFQSTIPIPTSGTVPPLQRLLWPNHSEDGTLVSRSSALPSVSSSSNVNNRLLGTSTSLKTPLSISVTHATTDTIPSVPVDRLGSYNSNSLIIPVVQRVHKDSQSFESSASTVTSKSLAARDGSFRPDINGNPTLFQLSKITSENKEEEKIDVCNVKDFLLKESSDVSSEIGRGHANTQYSDNDCPDESKEDGSTPMYSQLGCQCSRTVPNLMKYYAKHKRLLSSSLSVNLSVGGQSTPPCSPISPGTLSIVPPTNQRYSLEASTMTSPPDRSVSSDGSISDSNHRFSSGHSFTSATSGYSPKMSSPSSKSNKRKEDKETAQAGESTVRSDSMSRDSPVTSTRTAHPSRMTYPAHWPINPIAPYWIPPSHITGVDASVNSTNLGLGYQMATDQITGHLFLVPRPHPLSDPSGHGLMWTGYGGMPAPPVMMTPQQLLLGDPHYPHSLHAPIMPMRSNREPSKDDPKKPPTSQELDMTALPPHFLFPPSTLPYYYPPPPSHASSYNLSPYSHQRTSLLQTLSAPSVTTASLSTPSATVSSAPVASVWSRGTSRPIDSPGLRKDSKSNSNLAYSEPPIDLTQRKAKSPQAGEETSAETTVTKKEVPSLSIKKEIKQELLSPPAVSEAISLQSLPKTLKVKAEHVPVPYSGVDESNINLRNKEEVLETSQRPSSTEEEIKAVPLTRPKEEIDSSGLDLLFDTLLQHGDRLAPSPVIEDSDSSSCEQMPHLERAARTPSPRASPISDESLPPVLTPSAPIPIISSKISSPSAQQVTNSVFEPSEVSENAQVENSNCFSVLCALAEQRILEEQQNNSALSSLAELALANPSCEPILDKTLHDINSPNHEIPHVTPTLSPSYEPLPNITCDLLLNQSCSSLPDDAEFTDSDSQEQPTPYMCDEEKVKESDMNRNYKSPRSEREVKAYIANRMQQPNKEINYFPAYQLDDMAPSEVDMRMKLADLQRQYKEKQKELSKLPSRKLSSKKCRGRPRKPKKKSLTKDVCGSLKDESEHEDEDFNGFTPNSLSKDDEEESKSPCVPELISCPLNNVLKTDEETSDEEPLLDELPAIIDTMSLATKNEESDEEDAIIDTMSLATKNEESDEEDAISESSLRRDSVQVETSVESSTSDVELHPFSSSSKKRKPGRPKKHSPTKYDATETIVAKKHKSLSYLLLSQKSKMKPKLKAELIVKDKQEEGESEGWSICKVRSNTSEEDSDNVVKKKVMSMNSKNLKLSKHANGNAIHHHGAPRGRAALSRNSILRDKETRKTSFEKNSQMQQLFRSLKRHSKIADPEHDESGDERTDDDDKSDEEQQHETKVSFKIMSENGTSEPMKSLKQEELCVKIESNCDTESIEEEPKTVPKMYIKTEPCYFPSVETPPKIDAPKMNEKETKDPSSVCSLQVEDLVKGARVLILQEGLLYAGYLKPIDPPDVYGVLVDGERGTRPHICCQEQLLNQAWKEVKPGSTRFLTEGTRVCAFWSQQYRGLYTGCVAAASSPNHEGNHNLVNVEFDDGDSGRIHVDDIRLLPQDFPIIDHDPNPLLTLNKRKRRPTDEESLRDTRHFESKRRTQSCPTPPPLKLDEENGQTSNTIVDKGSIKPLSVLQESHMSAPIEISPVNENAINEPRKKHKKRRHSESHKHKHKHKRKRKDLFPTVEPGDNELRMRIKSPPPHNKTKSNHKDASSEEDSSTSDKEEVVRNSKKPSGRKKRSSSEKSRIAPFLLERQLWGWSGTGYKRPGCKGKGKKEFYKEIVRGKERIRVGDCAVFLSSGSPDRPFIGHIDFLWESWGGNMVVKVRWFYHMDETTCGVDKKLAEPRGALFASGHTDENDVQTISHKCAVVSLAEYRVRRAELEKKKGPSYENYDLYYLAGHYDASMGRITMEPGVS